MLIATMTVRIVCTVINTVIQLVARIVIIERVVSIAYVARILLTVMLSVHDHVTVQLTKYY